MDDTQEPRLPAYKVEDMWRSGYCADLVREASRTESAKAQARVQMVARHIASGCQDCRYAAFLRSIEGQASLDAGKEALFLYGLDATTPEQKHTAIERAFHDGRITPSFVAWITRVAQRPSWSDFESRAGA